MNDFTLDKKFEMLLEELRKAGVLIRREETEEC